MFKICTLCSSSKGNCSFISDGETNILVDCGIKADKLQKFLKEHNMQLSDISAIVITHEHIDHICGLKSLYKKAEVLVYAHSLVQKHIDERLGIKLKYMPVDMDGFNIGGIRVIPFKTSHDCIFPLGYTFAKGDKRVSYATDLGYVSSIVKENLAMSDMAIIEANHDKQMLEQGDYPIRLKRRVDGDLGHLSNDASGKLISELCEGKLKKVILAHLSENNNLPELAYSTVCSYIRKNPNLTGADITVEVAPCDCSSKILED